MPGAQAAATAVTMTAADVIQIVRHESAGRLPAALVSQSLEIANQCQGHLSLTLPWVVIAARSAGHLDELRVAELAGARQRAVGHVAYLESRVSMLGCSLRMRETPGNRLAAYYNSLLAPEPCFDSLLDALATQAHGRCDVLQFPALEIDSATDHAITAVARSSGWRLVRYPSFRSPYLATTGTWQQFLETKSQNFRYNLKRKRKGLEKAGKLEERWHRAPSDVPELIAAMHAIEEGSWKTHAGMSITGSERELAYHDLLLPWLAAIGALEANVLRLDGQPIAYSLCIRWLGKLGQLKTSFSESVSHLSPGLVVTTLSIENAFASGASEYDFLGDVMPHKMHWTDKVRAHRNVFAFLPTLRGALVGRAKQAMHALRKSGGPQTVGRSGWKS